MLRLTLLGGLTLERIDCPGVTLTLRRRLLALLALVAGHGTLGLSRDKLLAYLWPDSDALHARNSLKQALFSIRHTLGAQTLLACGDMIRLDARAIQVDVWEFEDALNSHHAARAVAIYGGPFLDGFFLTGLQEYEEWVEGERRRLGRRQIEALEELARRSTAAGDHPNGVHWWRQVVEADPLSASRALGFMRALEASGDRATALAHARSYASLIEAEFGAPVDPAVREFIQHLHRSSSSLPKAPEPQKPAPAPAPASAAVGGAEEVAERRRWAPPAAVPLTAWPERRRVAGARRTHGALTAMAEAPPVHPAVRRRIAAAVLLPLAVATFLAGRSSLLSRDPTPPLPAEEPARLTVLPFKTLGDSRDAELGRGLDALLASGMGDLDGYRLVPPPLSPEKGDGPPATASEASADAERAGARFYITGRLVVASTGLRASAVLRDRANADQEIGHTQAEAGPGELFQLADQLVRGLIDELYRGPGQEMASAAAAATRSLPALKAYLAGERALHEQDYPAARDAFRLAARADTAFALAYFRCSIAADRAGDDRVAAWGAALAAKFSERLSEHDRRLVTAYIVARRGRLDEAERLYRGILADYPQDGLAWFHLGELLLTGNPLRGRSAREARFAFERVLAADPDHGDALMYLARIAALEGKPREMDSLLRRAVTDSGRGRALDARAIRALALDGRPGGAAAVRDLLIQPWPVPPRVALGVAASPSDLGATERLADALVRASGTCEVRALGHRFRAHLAMARGKVGQFRRELTEVGRCDAGAALELRALMAVQPFVNPGESELANVARLLRLPDTTMRWPSRTYYAGLVAIRGGDTLVASRNARALLRTADTSAAGELARTFGRSLRAHVRFAAGQPGAALAQLEAAGWERTADQSVAEASDRFFRAELLRVLGRVDEAIGWYRSMAERATYELVYVAPAEQRLGRIFEARGEDEEATVHYRRFVDLWRAADADLQPVVDRVNRRLETQPSGK